MNIIARLASLKEKGGEQGADAGGRDGRVGSSQKGDGMETGARGSSTQTRTNPHINHWHSFFLSFIFVSVSYE